MTFITFLKLLYFESKDWTFGLKIVLLTKALWSVVPTV